MNTTTMAGTTSTGITEVAKVASGSGHSDPEYFVLIGGTVLILLVFFGYWYLCGDRQD